MNARQSIARVIRAFRTGGHGATSTPVSPLEVEKAEYGFYLQYLQPGMVVFDIGASVGEFSLLFSRFIGSAGAVHSFEANRETFDRLRKIMTLADCSNVHPNHISVCDRVGTVTLYVYDRHHSSWSTLADRPLPQYGIDVKPMCTEEVESTTVDAYCKAHAIDRIDLLKIDVEGAEYQVLRGARQMLRAARVRCCVFEFGQTTFDMGNHPDQIRRYLSECGYEIWNIVQGAPIFPGGSSAATAEFSMHVCRPRQ